MSFPFLLGTSVSTFYNDAPCFLFQVKVFCYSVGAEASYVCFPFPMLSVFYCVTMKSAFFVSFLLLIIYLILLSLKRSSLNYVFFPFPNFRCSQHCAVSLSFQFLPCFKSSVCFMVHHINFLFHFTFCNNYVYYKYSIATHVLIFYSLKWI